MIYLQDPDVTLLHGDVMERKLNRGFMSGVNRDAA